MLGVAHGYWTLTYAIIFLTGPVSSNSGSCSEVAMGGGSAGSGRVGLTSSARVLVRGGAYEATGEVLPARVVAKRAGWCAALTREDDHRAAEGALEPLRPCDSWPQTPRQACTDPRSRSPREARQRPPRLENGRFRRPAAGIDRPRRRRNSQDDRSHPPRASPLLVVRAVKALGKLMPATLGRTGAVCRREMPGRPACSDGVASQRALHQLRAARDRGQPAALLPVPCRHRIDRVRRNRLPQLRPRRHEDTNRVKYPFWCR
ncbi:MAG: hypothetical protein JWO75_4224 [Actinomycetia bacterium]|nr:hypothetical protein [Actinomycetes bacterium]